MQFDKVKRLVDDAKERGRVLLGGEPGEGLFFHPAIIAGYNNGDPLVDEEQFSPALPIIKYSDLDKAIIAANDSPNGLGGSIWTKDIEKGREIARRMECGSVWINKHGAIQPNAPFGAVKSSGLGVEFGDEGLAEYTDIQVIFSWVNPAQTTQCNQIRIVWMGELSSPTRQMCPFAQLLCRDGFLVHRRLHTIGRKGGVQLVVKNVV